ncbi:hypothetical protein BEWA_021650 [Theileria equi strain WA]|uniref:Uncharacterized protein n=1 Tax=Theileria equi strain WA TaxID=1537102 RepID=L0AUL2_THEEQ|nr:hypothetical protein BEWA_021650 [Theileria equi strain WA]AFZ79317.1 hypothetical protein BEWA_021650 [Theileria equi strain WA]|eukprot:XP_004828983.1 hypothetical protein BEWA_021650 [Theileria equi strain WA]
MNHNIAQLYTPIINNYRPYESHGYDNIISKDMGNSVNPDLLVERSLFKDGLMMQLSTQQPMDNDPTISMAMRHNMKAVDTDDLVSANAHYTLEDFFHNYGDLSVVESIDDVFNTDLDFSRLSGSFDEPNLLDPSFESLIDLVKCDIVENEPPVPEPILLPPEPNFTFLYQNDNTLNIPLEEIVQKSRPKPKAKQRRSPPVRREIMVAPHANEVERKETVVNDRRIDYGANDTPENIQDLEWHPGFTRHLGAKGRTALLELVRKVYRQDPTHYKAILQSRNPPSSISNLPFFSIPMIWELTHQFGIFKQALMVYKNNCFSKGKNRFHGSANSNSAKAANSPPKYTSNEVYTHNSVKREISGSEMDNINAVIPHMNQITTMSGRTIKRSKKAMESSPIIHSMMSHTQPMKNETGNMTLNDGIYNGRLTSSISIGDDIAVNLLGSPDTFQRIMTEDGENDMEVPFIWNTSEVSAVPQSYMDDTIPAAAGSSFNQRISV